MRISTNQMYDTAMRGMQRGQSSLSKLQNQMSTGRRVLTPEDDPVAAAAALNIKQAQAVNSQHIANQANATDQLRLVDSQLSSLTSALQNVRDLVLQAGNTTLGASDRASIASDLEARLSEVLGIANSQNGVGDYLFSGYQGGTLPFSVGATGAAYAYSGDEGERLLQVAASRQLAVTVPGSEVFMNVKAGNGSFVTGTAAGGTNTGTATIDAGAVLEPQLWSAAVNTTPAIAPWTISFAPNAAPPGQMQYSVVDATGATTTADYTDGMSIALSSGATAYAKVVIKGQPKSGDSFTITPSANQSIFQTLQDLVATVRAPVGSSTMSNTEYSGALAAGLTNLDQSLNNVARVQTTVGTRLRELESLTNTSTDLDIQYEDSWGKLIGLDYAKAISDFTLQQTYLEAAQKSFAQISSSSLFNYL